MDLSVPNRCKPEDLPKGNEGRFFRFLRCLNAGFLRGGKDRAEIAARVSAVVLRCRFLLRKENFLL